MQNYKLWLEDDYFDGATKQELKAIEGDEKEIEDRFFKALEFGTGGLRGVIGAGTNRMNFYTVGKATQGLANYIIKKGRAESGVAIAFDSRRFSKEFAERSALVLAANGIKAYVFESLRPTPELSFAVRELGCVSGIVITASHNPPEYNGYKCYWDDGGQVVSPWDNEIIEEVNLVENFSDCKLISLKDAKKAGLYIEIGKKIDDKFIKCVLNQSLNPGAVKKIADMFKIVYTPLNGAGNLFVRRALAELGFTNVFVVPEQENPDPDFTTIGYPNPEDPNAFKLALALAKEKDADIIIATDPDSDRVGSIVRDKNGEYVMLSGNMAGVLLCEYILSQKTKNKTLPENSAVISTIVSTDLTKVIAKTYGASYFDVLTGFKNIGSMIKDFEQTGKYEFVFGFEESYGYLSGTHARDKDAIVSAMLLCEYAAYLKLEGKTLTDALGEIYEKYGYFKESTQSITLKGVEGLKAIKTIMENIRSNPPSEVCGQMVFSFGDYKNRITKDMLTGQSEGITLPVSDVLYFVLGDGSWFCIRPSGTEPKIKIYFGVKGKTEEEADKKMKDLSAGVMYIINKEIP
ncbi:MAG: phospho-sugar mutase [Clostridiales bacterium]|jgi:phosphoglucomutase|nr:phospho-sugar mutase [Clostridiales bacterium]